MQREARRIARRPARRRRPTMGSSGPPAMPRRRRPYSAAAQSTRCCSWNSVGAQMSVAYLQFGRLVDDRGRRVRASASTCGRIRARARRCASCCGIELPRRSRGAQLDESDDRKRLARERLEEIDFDAGDLEVGTDPQHDGTDARRSGRTLPRRCSGRTHSAGPSRPIFVHSAARSSSSSPCSPLGSRTMLALASGQNRSDTLRPPSRRISSPSRST